jgi:uncharacterized protein (TIGR02421 family)
MKESNTLPPVIEKISAQLRQRQHIHETLLGQGRLKMEGHLPFLLIYRYPSLPKKHAVKLVIAESSYLIASGDEGHLSKLKDLLMEISSILSKSYGSVMFLEIWEGPINSTDFIIKAPKDIASATIEVLSDELKQMSRSFPGLDVKTEFTANRHPEDMKPLLTVTECLEVGCFLAGLEIPPFYQSVENDEFYHLYFQKLRKNLSKVLRKTIFSFLRIQTSSDIQSYHALGSRKIEPIVWEVDKQLAEIEQSYRFLLLISPINTLKARDEFGKSKFKTNPKFLYRILPIDPDQLKEELYQIKVRAIEDPTLGYLYREKREEIDKQLTMLSERGTKNFMYSSIRLYDSVDPELLQQAKAILRKFPSEHTLTQEWADCHDLAQAARDEINRYKQIYPELDSTVSIKHDIIGMMVSKGQVLIGESFKVPRNRVEALIHHEVGTHVLTYYNGKAQPLKLLYSGFADYDELQEGLAVMAEFLTGGLTRGRLRLLAARVVAGHSLTEGADFCATFHELKDSYGFEMGTAFDVTARIHQGGGCTKDIIYLRGLIKLMDYIKNGGELAPLFVGKISQKHVPLIEELDHRNILRPMPLLPRYLKDTNVIHRLALVKEGLSVDALIKV